MPTMAALTINDGQATPVAHTFAVGTTNGALATWYDKVSGIPVGYAKLDYEVRKAKSATAADRCLVSLYAPTTAVVDGVTKKVRVNSAKIELNFAQDSTLQERKDMVAYLTNFLSNATAKPALQEAEPFF